MNPPPDFLSRRDALKATMASVGLSSLAFEPAKAAPSAPDTRRGSTKKYDMLKSINLWAFPYPERMTLRECLQLAKDAGFDGIELACCDRCARRNRLQGLPDLRVRALPGSVDLAELRFAGSHSGKKGLILNRSYDANETLMGRIQEFID